MERNNNHKVAITCTISINKTSCFENEKHQTRVSLLLELVSDAYLNH